jgi:hypothetical protein
MPSIVDELASQALNDEVTIDTLLRRAKAIASLLELEDLAQWFDLELYGYAEKDEVPSYRIITGVLYGWSPYYRDWVPIVWESGEARARYSSWPMRDSLAEVWE